MSSETDLVGWKFDNTYVRLPPAFYVKAQPEPATEPRLVVVNRPLARELGLDPIHLESQDAAQIFSGNRLPPGASPIAQAYAGHQFGHFTMLGDGRAILLGEQITPEGKRFDIQLKGSGRTPFSRRGDGKAALGPMLREFIISEAMHHLGIPTTRSLAVVATGDMILRETPLRGAVLVRVASSHIRVGTFEYAACLGDRTLLESLAVYTIARHFPDINPEDPQRFLLLLQGVATRQARLVAKWMLSGFIHGVMNTDNMALSGETIDYGPCAFMDEYDPNTAFSSIDHAGRYAYSQQPLIARWNLARFAEALLPLLNPNTEKAIVSANEILEDFSKIYEEEWLSQMRVRLGLQEPREGDADLARELLEKMYAEKADFTNTFRALATGSSLPEGFEPWLTKWRTRLASEGRTQTECLAAMQAVTPAIIPRNHKVEEALAAANDGVLSVLEELLVALDVPYDHSRAREKFQQPSPAGRGNYRTFCGT